MVLGGEGGAVEFRVHIDLAALGRESITLSTHLSPAWLKKPLDEALVGPLLKSPRLASLRLTLAHVHAVLVEEQPAALSARAAAFVRGDGGVMRVLVRLGRPSAGALMLAHFSRVACLQQGLGLLLALLCAAVAGAFANSSTPSRVGERASTCDMATLDGPSTPLPQLASRLAASSEPIIVRQGMAGWQGSLSRLLDEHAAFPLRVARGAVKVNDDSAAAFSTSLADYSAGLRSGSYSAREYVFNQVENSSMASAMPELRDLFSHVACLQRGDYCELAPAAALGTTNLAYGGDGSSNGWHAHGTALNGLLSGEKLWGVRNLSAGKAWTCWQAVGDLVWVPDGLEHAVLANRGVEVLALATQFVRPGMPALAQATFAGLAAEVRALLEAGSAADQPDGHGSRALHAAANEGRAEIAAMLLAAGASPAKVGPSEVPPLHLASHRGHAGVVRLLLEAGAPVDATRQVDGSTALHSAAATGRAEVVRALVAAGAAVGAKTLAGETALQHARTGREQGHADAAEILQSAANERHRATVSSLGWREVQLPEQALWRGIPGYYRHAVYPVLTFRNEMGGLGDPLTMDEIYRRFEPRPDDVHVVTMS